MADNTDSGSDAQVTFKVKTSGDKSHTVTVSEASTVKDLKNMLAGDDYEGIPIERQRLIYSGRVLKNDDTIGSYKIKPNNTVHMVKSAASNPAPAPSANSASTPQSTGVPSNMASGTANNPLAGLTGARYAGHQINLPGMDMFGPDGGMGPPMSEENMQRMMEDPNVQSQMNEALSNPDFIDMLVQSNPMLRNLPNAREILQSPFMRQMMTNPGMLRNAMRMQRNMGGGNSAFPAPGATDTTPSDAPSGGEAGANNAQGQQNPFANPFVSMGGLGGMGGAQGGAQGGNNPLGNPEQLAAQLQAMMYGSGNRQQGEAGAGAAPAAQGAQGSTGTTEGQQGAGQGTDQQNQANPFAALFPGIPGGDAQGNNNPFGMSPEMMQQMMQMMGGAGAGGGPQAPADNRPPEERYENELRQLNDMGFYDFDRNVAALRRSGGSVQGAVEYLLSN